MNSISWTVGPPALCGGCQGEFDGVAFDGTGGECEVFHHRRGAEQFDLLSFGTIGSDVEQQAGILVDHVGQDEDPAAGKRGSLRTLCVVVRVGTGLGGSCGRGVAGTIAGRSRTRFTGVGDIAGTVPTGAASDGHAAHQQDSKEEFPE